MSRPLLTTSAVHLLLFSLAMVLVGNLTYAMERFLIYSVLFKKLALKWIIAKALKWEKFHRLWAIRRRSWLSRQRLHGNSDDAKEEVGRGEDYILFSIFRIKKMVILISSLDSHNNPRESYRLPFLKYKNGLRVCPVCPPPVRSELLFSQVQWSHFSSDVPLWGKDEAHVLITCL